ncbi:peptide-methionine (S)-S-oxide reductase MsrA [Streptomyces monticola]|uniref:peptide-methionine (S)-S-oxide reductase n=1 Tax=Streptomyces monticola TaxID=2666263 RepID=A0ABW2JEW7_9ACTN
MFKNRNSTKLTADEALPGRAELSVVVPERHAILGTALLGPYPEGYEIAEFGVDCYWSGEAAFWDAPGVWTTVAGYQGGVTPFPTPVEVLTDRTGHTESVRVVFDPRVTSYEALLEIFWERHDPTRPFGPNSQARSSIFTRSLAQQAAAEASREALQQRLRRPIATEIVPAQEYPFYPSDAYNQQYLAGSRARR